LAGKHKKKKKLGETEGNKASSTKLR